MRENTRSMFLCYIHCDLDCFVDAHSCVVCPKTFVGDCLSRADICHGNQNTLPKTATPMIVPKLFNFNLNNTKRRQTEEKSIPQIEAHLYTFDQQVSTSTFTHHGTCLQIPSILVSPRLVFPWFC